MDKTTTTLVDALNAGKLPTTQQFDRFVEWVESDVGLFAAAATEETEEEKEKSNLTLIAKDMKEVLDAYRSVLNDKNCGFFASSFLFFATNTAKQPITFSKTPYGTSVSVSPPPPPKKEEPPPPPLPLLPSPKTSKNPALRS